MKKYTFFFFFLAFVTLGLECYGQKQPILPYGKYSPEKIKKFASGLFPKALQFNDLIFRKTGENNLDSLFKKIRVVGDTTLPEGSYLNSCWNDSTRKIEFYPGKEFTGDVLLYDDKVYKAIICKDSCANLIDSTRRATSFPNKNQLSEEDQEAENYRGLLSPSSPASAYPLVNGDKNNNSNSFNKYVYNFYSSSEEKEKVVEKKKKNLGWKIAGGVAGAIILTAAGFEIAEFIKKPPPIPDPGDPGGANQIGLKFGFVFGVKIGP